MLKWVVATAMSVVMASIALADDGVTPDKVTVGQVAAFTGPASALGNGMRTGIKAAFDEVNAKGGVRGRKLVLVTRDDSYEPADSEMQTRKIIEQDKVFALIGTVGTPTAKAAQPVAQAAGVPFVAPFTGAAFLRNASLHNVVNLRASYDQETEAWISYLVDSRKIGKVAVLFQDDAFGQAGLTGVRAAMQRRHIAPVAEASFMRNTTQVEKAVAAIRAAAPQAVVLVGPYAPCAAFIRQARKAGLDALFLNISFVGSEALADALGDEGEGVIVSQVVPLPWDRTVPVVSDYQRAIGGERPGFVSLEGYMAGRLFISALDKAGQEPTREKLLEAIAAMSSVDMGGVKLSFGRDDNQGSDSVYLTQLTSDGQFKTLPAGN